jgi:hypothetical protein
VPSGTAGHAQIVKAAGDRHGSIGQAVSEVAKLVFGNPTNLDPSIGMLHADARPRQMAIVPFLAWLQFRVLGLFLGCRCSRTAGA